MNPWISQLTALYKNFAALGSRRIMTLFFVMISTVAILGTSAYYLARPANEVLYAGLTKQDSSRATMALKDAGIEFDLSLDSSTIYVRRGHAPRVRMILAQRGLPNSNASGYELFEKVNIFGLTTFMQDVTKTRAIEGELSRTLQMIEGIRYARVHLVIPDRNSSRIAQYEPSASVILQIEGSRDRIPTSAIRHLIAGAVPKLSPKKITIASNDGELLTGPDESDSESFQSTRRLETEISRALQNNIKNAISPHVTPSHHKVSVVVKFNTDRRETVERNFIPESKVERSIKGIRENSDSQSSPRDPAVSVQQNIPRQDQQGVDDKRRNETTQKREELTNFEISSKSINTVSGGYTIQNLSVAVTINRLALPEVLRNPDAKEKLQNHVGEIEALVSAAAGINRERGDQLKILLTDFSDAGDPSAEIRGSAESLNLISSLVQYVSLIVVTLAFIFLAIVGANWQTRRPSESVGYRFEEVLANEGSNAVPVGASKSVPGGRYEKVARELEVLLFKQVLDVWLSTAKQNVAASAKGIKPWSDVINEVLARPMVQSSRLNLAKALEARGAGTAA